MIQAQGPWEWVDDSRWYTRSRKSEFDAIADANLQWLPQGSDILDDGPFAGIDTRWADWVAESCLAGRQLYLLECIPTYFPDLPIWPRWQLLARKGRDEKVQSLGKFEVLPDPWEITGRAEWTYRRHSSA